MTSRSSVFLTSRAIGHLNGYAHLAAMELHSGRERERSVVSGIGTTIDLARARRETPGCAHVLHFNNAGASLLPQPVLDAAIDYLQLEAELGGYETADREQEAIARFYGAAAELLHCDPDEIAFIENATRAWDMAFYALPFAPGDRILTARAEYVSNVVMLRTLLAVRAGC